MAVLTRVALCVVALMLTAACRTGQEQWGPFRGQVVDSETGKPIAGAHVMALWIREPPSLHYQQRVYDARETVTDADGRFEIPYERRWLTAWVKAPRIDVFVPGYVMERAAVVTREGRPYVDPTFVGMRLLQTAEQRCAFEPSLHVLISRSHVPNYAAAIDTYVDSLTCSTLRN